MLKTLRTIFAAGVAESEEALFDANAIRILEQRTREASDAFETLKSSLARVLALKAGEDRKVDALTLRIETLENEAGSHLKANDNAQAHAIAEKIAVLEDERAAHIETSERCRGDSEAIRKKVDAAARRLAELKRGISVARSAGGTATSTPLRRLYLIFGSHSL